MPSIGRPNLKNNFANIKMAEQRSKKSINDKPEHELLNEISGNSNVNGGVEFVDRKKHNTLGKNEFMKLLSHQLANQDPLNPVDQKKFASELAQFSSLEQLANINSKLKSMDRNAPSEGKFYGASFLGKQVMTGGTTLKYPGEGGINAPFNLPQNAKALMVRIYDKSNQMVAQIDRENYASGVQSVSWDGKMQDGTVAAKGDYHFEVLAWDKNYTPFKGETKNSGIVTAVNFKDGETIFEVDGKKTVFLRDVENFRLVEHKSKVAEQIPTSAAQKKMVTNNYENINQMGN